MARCSARRAAPQAPPHAAPPADTGALEEITGTAQKRTEDLQTVPISLQVLGGEKLQALQDYRAVAN